MIVELQVTDLEKWRKNKCLRYQLGYLANMKLTAELLKDI